MNWKMLYGPAELTAAAESGGLWVCHCTRFSWNSTQLFHQYLLVAKCLNRAADNWMWILNEFPEKLHNLRFKWDLIVRKKKNVKHKCYYEWWCKKILHKRLSPTDVGFLKLILIFGDLKIQYQGQYFFLFFLSKTRKRKYLIFLFII